MGCFLIYTSLEQAMGSLSSVRCAKSTLTLLTLAVYRISCRERRWTPSFLQADEILVKPMAIPDLVKLIRERLDKRGNRRATNIERVASILEREASATIADWLRRVERDDELTRIAPQCMIQRAGHPAVGPKRSFHRRCVPRSLGTKQISEGAVEHGTVRRSQGYTIPMIIEESRMLQVSIFHTLQNNLNVMDFSLLLLDVMAIADEVDSQLKQTITSFTEPAVVLAAFV